LAQTGIVCVNADTVLYRHDLRRAAAALLALAPLVALPHAARAQTPPPQDERVTQAEALVQQGVAQRRAGQDQLALESFRRANELSPAPRTRAQIALAEQALGQWAEADRDLRAALSAGQDQWIQRNRGALEAALNAIAGRIATIEVLCATEGARLFVNGQETSGFPLTDPLRLAAGTIALEVRRDGYRTVRRAIDVEGGRSYRESFSLVPNALADDPEPDPTRGVDRTRRPPPVVEPPPPPVASTVLLGAGAGMLALGIVGHVYWQNRVSLYNSDVILRADGGFEEGCFLSTASYPRRSDRCSAILTESWAGFGLALTGYVLGAAGVGAGLYLRFARRPETAAPLALSCAPTFGLTGAQCLVRF
jgi:tetratricopeptide (TPR) repeat protein